MGKINIISSIGIKKFLYRDFLQLLVPSLHNSSAKPLDKSADYLNWFNCCLVDHANDFVNTYDLNNSFFIKQLNSSFKTTRFKLLLKQWIVDYLSMPYSALFDFYNSTSNAVDKFPLFDNSLNRFAVEKFCQKFNTDFSKIEWIPQMSLGRRFLSVFIQALRIFYFCSRSGIKILNTKKRYKVMREAIWGLYDSGGYYFHDDFLVDEVKIKKNDLLLFSRISVLWDEGRLKAYSDAKKSGYAHFFLPSLSIGINSLLFRIIPKYIFAGCSALSSQVKSSNFLLFQNIYWDFAFFALAYEKVFSHFKVTSELGHNYFSATHISESIVCQNYGVKYYLMHWSDDSVDMNKHIGSFLGCDNYLAWGKAHIRVVGGEGNIILTGYPFKVFVQRVICNRAKVLNEMNIAAHGKIITFFDESFGDLCLMTEKHFVNFWQVALTVAESEKDSTIVIKPKGLERVKNLSDDMRNRFILIKEQLEKMSNVYILDSKRWSFIEAIGISDIVVTQGMTSSSTIAIICGILGLYLDEARYNHPFSQRFRDKIVFTEPEKLISMIRSVLRREESPLKIIPEELLRHYDEFPDERGLDLYRDILSGRKKRVGIIIQARMGSTRLPGKVMLPILGKPVLRHIIDRLKRCNHADVIVLATTVNKDDDVLEKLAKENNLKVFRGDEQDVLSRYYYAAKENKLDVVIRITADCPFIDPEIIDNMILNFLDNNRIDYLSNVLNRTFPRGLDTEIFKFSTLHRAFESAKNPYQREHVTPYIYEHKELFMLSGIENKESLSHLRWTLDEEKDFEFIKEIYNRLYRDNNIFLTKDILAVLEKEPHLAEINKYVR